MYFIDDLSVDDENEHKVLIRPCSPEQFGYLQCLANKYGSCLQTLVMWHFSKRPGELSSTEACELIDELKSQR